VDVGDPGVPAVDDDRLGGPDPLEAGFLAIPQEEPLEVGLRRLRLVALCGGRRSRFDVRGRCRPALVPVVAAAGRMPRKAAISSTVKAVLTMD